MRPLDLPLLEALRDLARGFEARGVRFCIIGALVPQFLLDVEPKRITNDADAVVVVQSLDDFDVLKRELSAFRFRPTSLAIRLEHDLGGRVDILPYSRTLAPGGKLQLPGDLSFNVAGFDQIFTSLVRVEIENGLTVPLAPLPLYVLLKLVAFSDRRAPKDLGSVLHCVRHYGVGSDRRYGLEHDGTLVPFEMTTAFMLGIDSRPFDDEALRRTVAGVLDQLTHADAPGVDIAGREEGMLFLGTESRREIADLFRWFRVGASL